VIGDFSGVLTMIVGNESIDEFELPHLVRMRAHARGRC
jgi:hypothetical protein